MSNLAQDIKEAVESFYKAAAGDSSDDEHDAACEMADLLVGIARSFDSSIVIQSDFDYDADDE
jgi:hypothetical protein